MNEQELGVAFFMAPLGMALVSLTGEFIEVNPKLCILVGRSRELLIGTPFADITHPDDLQESIDSLNLLSSGKIDAVCLEKRYLLPDGGLVWARLHVNPLLAEDGAIRYFLATFEDISIRKNIESRYLLNEQKYRSALATCWDGYWINDFSGRIIEVNDAYCRISGYSREEILGMHVADLDALQSVSEIQSNIQRLFDRGHISFETEHRTKTGQKVPLRINANYNPNLGERILAFMRDLSAEKQLSQALLFSANQNQKIENRARSAEMALVSVSETTLREIGCDLHDDLGQDLTAGSLIAENLANRVAQYNPKDAEGIRHLSKMLSKCVFKLRKISHGLYPSELEQVGVQRMLRKLVQDWNNTGKLHAVYYENCTKELADYETSLQLYRIAQEAGKNVLLHSQARHVVLEFNYNDFEQELKISDDGVGIPTDYLQHHDPGIGLRTMKARADMIGAQFLLQPNFGGGTQVIIKMQTSD